jgi:hypothetical protein
LAILGPGAIVASLTIGAGELVFSSRGGALFGFPLLSLFVLICLLKWALVLLTARQMVLTGAHPLERWAQLPGPRGWLVWVFLLLAIPAFPVWVGFHAGTVGTLIAAVTNTRQSMSGASHYAWGLFILLVVMGLVRTGGYDRLERIQMAIVAVMLVTVSVSLVLLHPDWAAMVRGLFSPGAIEYPAWREKFPQLATRPLWVELVSYVGVLGGSGYDYLAYVSFLRDKRWGAAGGPVLDESAVQAIAADPRHPCREWLRAPLLDASVSFLVVFFFSAVFVASGATVLRPLEQIPEGSDLLTLQAKFMSAAGAWMQPMYFVGAFLAMLGTLYGTIEVAPTVAREMARALGRPDLSARWIHRWVTNWVGFGGAMVLGASLAWTQQSAARNETPPGLIRLLDPANLFTGVLACGLICGLACWADGRFLPASLRAPRTLWALNAVACPLFLALGVRAYWDYGGVSAFLLLAATLASGLAAAQWHERRRKAGG